MPHSVGNSRQDITWGLGYRFIDDQLGSSPLISRSFPISASKAYTAVLCRTKSSLVPDCLKLTLGTKLEHNDFSGFEVEPNVRLLWSINKRQAAWQRLSPVPSALRHRLMKTSGSSRAPPPS